KFARYLWKIRQMRKNPLYLKVLVVLLLLLAALLFVVNSRAAVPILQGQQTPQFVWLSSWQPVQGTPTRRHALGRLPTPPPLPENLLSDCTENCPLRPLRAPRRFGIRKSASNSGHSPLRGLGGCSMHCSMHYSMHCSTHCRPSLFAAHRR